jgi:FKBP-type peptidyl-prolyl cis-trans isomerase FklB
MSLFDKLHASRKAKVDEEKTTGAAFLAENKKNEGVIELPNGIQYQVLKEGNGEKPDIADKIKAHYAGRLINGKEFDSSYRRNSPFTAPIRNLIEGWQIVLPMMPVNSKWRLWIPSDLAYGDNGAGGSIPGGAVLDFEIELLEIIK